LAPWAYRLLRRAGFRGVAITDSLGVLGSGEATRAARLAVKAGADLVLFTSAEDARAAIRALVPLARTGLLDVHVRRVLRLRESAGLARGGGW
jgi:beta-glucosidase-like glycosyl hydrolase